MHKPTPEMMNTLKRAAALGSAGASAYIAHDALDYLNLKQTLPASEAPPRGNRPVVTATQKDWTLYGRQSPMFVRDSKKNPKNRILEKIKASSIYFDALGTRMDNEKHFALFEGTDFCVEPMTSDKNASQVMLPPEKMRSTDLDNLPEDALYEVGFARKQGFADLTDHSPFYHSSIALREVTPESPASVGALVMTGREMKMVMARTNENICEKQHCTLVESNCYTASVYAMGEMIRVISARSGNPETHAEDVQKVTDILSDAAFENFGRGVSNNTDLSRFLTDEIQPIIQAHQALISAKDLDSPPSDSDTDAEDDGLIKGLPGGLPYG